MRAAVRRRMLFGRARPEMSVLDVTQAGERQIEPSPAPAGLVARGVAALPHRPPEGPTQMNPIATVPAEIDLRLVVPGGPSLPVLADLRYDTVDPWAVRVAFQTGGEGDGIVGGILA